MGAEVDSKKDFTFLEYNPKKAILFWIKGILSDGGVVDGGVGGGDGGAEEVGGQGGEAVGVFGGEEADGAVARDAAVHLGMAPQVVDERAGDDFALFHDSDALGNVLPDFIDEQGIVGAAQNNRVDVGVGREGLVDVGLDEEIGAGAVGEAVFDQRHP